MKRFLFLILCFGLLTISASATDHAGYLERSELRFLEGMSDHHQMALDMANDCLDKATTPEVRAICEAVIAAQTPEIEQMAAWLLDWYNVEYKTMSMSEMSHDMPDNNAHAGHGGHNMGGAQPFTDPAMMMGMFAGFNRLDGVEYDIAWLESMIDHHDDALHMAERLLERGVVHTELIPFAQNIIDAQTAEIAQMEALIEQLAG